MRRWGGGGATHQRLLVRWGDGCVHRLCYSYADVFATPVMMTSSSSRDYVVGEEKPITVDSKFAWGSCTKMVTGISILRLVEGKDALRFTVHPPERTREDTAGRVSSPPSLRWHDSIACLALQRCRGCWWVHPRANLWGEGAKQIRAHTLHLSMYNMQYTFSRDC